jgi:hypothetical protein
VYWILFQVRALPWWISCSFFISIDFKGLDENGLPTFVNEDGNVTVSDINFQEREKKGHLIYEGPMILQLQVAWVIFSL